MGFTYAQIPQTISGTYSYTSIEDISNEGGVVLQGIQKMQVVFEDDNKLKESGIFAISLSGGDVSNYISIRIEYKVELNGTFEIIGDTLVANYDTNSLKIEFSKCDATSPEFCSQMMTTGAEAAMAMREAICSQAIQKNVITSFSEKKFVVKNEEGKKTTYKKEKK
ncbi:hypothetical protein FACS1894153_4680 [Bacteroidia bacterium]|nr:hypothetical protein FACS1894153_4680 [Bacteroidia bacterium]